MEIVTHERFRNEEMRAQDPLIQTLSYPIYYRKGEAGLHRDAIFSLMATDIRGDNRIRIHIPESWVSNTEKQ